jgi:hypothetical protein
LKLPPPHKLLAGPEIEAGMAGTFLPSVKQLVELCPQPFTARTLNVPLLNELPKLKEIVFVPKPETIVVPEGTDHKYEVALLTDATE